MNIGELEKKANWVRQQILEMIVSANKGHIGGALSCTDILVALYYGGILRFDPYNPNWSERDRFILSKGHSCVALYAVLADLGFFPISELNSFCQKGSMLGGHPDKNIPGIETDTGSLGHGLGIASGLALSVKMNKKDFMNVVLLGDGECHEGSLWEAAMFAAHYRLSNLIAVVDYNRQCSTDFIEDCVRLEPFADKWRAFGWEVREVNGHSFEELLSAFEDFRSRKSSPPLAVIANTIKGKGISFMERKISWHHGVPSGEELERARQELALRC
ncbi:MAG: transketolase [Dehalococcoidia bacterium]